MKIANFLNPQSPVNDLPDENKIPTSFKPYTNIRISKSRPNLDISLPGRRGLAVDDPTADAQWWSTSNVR